MWLKIDELHTDTDVHFIHCNKAFVSSVRCLQSVGTFYRLTDWLIDYRLFGCDWLYSLESVTVQLRAHVIHSYYLWHEWDMNPPLKVRPFLFVCLFVSNTFVHPVIHLLLRWALLPNAPSSNDSFTVVLTYLSGYSVNGRCTGKKTKKCKIEQQAEEKQDR